ncbi:S-acyl fatty acid synthase thioesterase, medium chain isoform X2 [Lepisosteus oculatus]|uniref:S-acyl fatty acid synthase thioesterase, medium chain isoform X2 n=1 Tax=Lepisosteus oculatus TaxID=7918 RepID=UPI0035F52E42
MPTPAENITFPPVTRAAGRGGPFPAEPEAAECGSASSSSRRVTRDRMKKSINCFCKRPDALVRLVCFPWAGGGSIHYARWGSLLNSSVEVYSVKLPGREGRAKEPFLMDMQQVVDEVVSALLPELREKPFALFGHSFGAMASFATADHLKRVHGLEPVHLFVSGASAPHSEARLCATKRSDLTDEEFLNWLTSIGGTPPEILTNQEVLKLFLPVLKADLSVVENYRYLKPERSILSCPVTCFDGTQDIPHDLQAWKDISSGEFTIKMLPGSHFYLKDPTNEKILLDYITRYLETAEMDYMK